jgi:hypothetical protein
MQVAGRAKEIPKRFKRRREAQDAQIIKTLIFEGWAATRIFNSNFRDVFAKIRSFRDHFSRPQSGCRTSPKQYHFSLHFSLPKEVSFSRKNREKHARVNLYG